MCSRLRITSEHSGSYFDVVARLRYGIVERVHVSALRWAT